MSIRERPVCEAYTERRGRRWAKREQITKLVSARSCLHLCGLQLSLLSLSFSLFLLSSSHSLAFKAVSHTPQFCTSTHVAIFYGQKKSAASVIIFECRRLVCFPSSLVGRACSLRLTGNRSNIGEIHGATVGRSRWAWGAREMRGRVVARSRKRAVV